MASFVENTQHKVERKAFEIMTNSIVGKLTKTDDKRTDTKLDKETQSSLLKSEAEKKVAEHKLAEDDIKGLVYDEQL